MQDGPRRGFGPSLRVLRAIPAGRAEVIVVKNRCGGGGYATLLYRAAYTMFQDGEPAWTPTGLG